MLVIASKPAAAAPAEEAAARREEDQEGREGPSAEEESFSVCCAGFPELHDAHCRGNGRCGVIPRVGGERRRADRSLPLDVDVRGCGCGASLFPARRPSHGALRCPNMEASLSGPLCSIRPNFPQSAPTSLICPSICPGVSQSAPMSLNLPRLTGKGCNPFVVLRWHARPFLFTMCCEFRHPPRNDFQLERTKHWGTSGRLKDVGAN